MRLCPVLCSIILASNFVAFALADEQPPEFTAQQREFFSTEIFPLLKKKCLGCHGNGDKLESNFDMRTRQGVLQGGEIGIGAVSGKAEKSPVYQAVLRDGDLVMPPKERNRLEVLEIDALRRWIDMGLPWADNTTSPTGAWSVRAPDSPRRGS